MTDRGTPPHGVPTREEPHMEYIEEDGRICVVVTLPGVTETGIRIELENHVLVISASGTGTEYRKDILLPWNARVVRKRFRDGKLDLILERTGSAGH